jgi:hypothetical protein
MGRRKTTPFTEFADRPGELWVRQDLWGFELLIAMIDGLTMAVCKKDAFLRPETIIEWHTKELEYQPNRKHSKQIIEIMQKAVDQFKSGKMEFQLPTKRPRRD